MNRLLFTLLLLCWAGSAAWGQKTAPAKPTNGSLRVKLTVKDDQGKPMTATTVEFIEYYAKKSLKTTTDAQGYAEIVLTEGKVWQMAILQIRDYFYWQIEMPKVPVGMEAELTKVVTYDYAYYRRETRPAVDRSFLKLQKVEQNYGSNEQPADTMAVLKLMISKADRSPLAYFPVSITCYAQNKTYTTRTNGNGLATFKVPCNHEYQVDIDGIDNFTFVDLPNTKRYIGTQQFTYEPTSVKETVRQDTVRQSLGTDVHSTSARTLVTMQVHDRSGQPWANEKVFLSKVNDKTVYEALTDDKGHAKFLLPKGARYMINFRYEQNVDVFDLTRNRGIGHANKYVVYRPVERLQYPERYIPRPENLAIDEYIDFGVNDLPRPQQNETLLASGLWGGPVNAQSREAVLQLGFTSEYSDETKRSSQLNLAFVVDRSGSMAAENRIEWVKRAASEFVKRLKDDDVVSLIGFDDAAMVLVASLKVGGNRQQLLDEIARLEPGGSTNIHDGLKAGYEHVLKQLSKKGTNRVILLTDGLENTKTPEEIIAMSRSFNAKGVECSTVGVGADYNAALLRQLSADGGGSIALLDSVSHIQQAFARELSSLVVPMAKNVRIEVEYNPKVYQTADIFGFALEEKREGKLSAKLRNFYAGLDQLALVRFRLQNPSADIESQAVTIRLKYVDIRKNQSVSTETKTYPKFVQDAEVPLISSAAQREKYAEAVMRKALRDMAEAFAKNQRSAAKKAIEEGLNEYKRLFAGPKPANPKLNSLVAEATGYLDIFNNLKD